jgi:hypothetical protein
VKDDGRFHVALLVVLVEFKDAIGHAGVLHAPADVYRRSFAFGHGFSFWLVKAQTPSLAIWAGVLRLVFAWLSGWLLCLAGERFQTVASPFVRFYPARRFWKTWRVDRGVGVMCHQPGTRCPDKLLAQNAALGRDVFQPQGQCGARRRGTL